MLSDQVDVFSISKQINAWSWRGMSSKKHKEKVTLDYQISKQKFSIVFG